MFWDPILISDLFRPHGGLAARRDPFARLLSPPRARARRTTPPGPAVNLHANDEEARVTALVPGLAAEDLELSIEGALLTLAGERRTRAGSEDERTTRFSRTVRLPFPCDREAVEATLERGVLEVRLPRAAEDRPRRIDVTSR